MGMLTEQEIFDCLVHNFRVAVDCCERLAQGPKRDSTYVKLREALGLVEECGRQAAYWREDTRWLPVGLDIARIRNMAGNWLRVRDPVARHQAMKNFKTLGTLLRAAQKITEDLRTKRTGRAGLILPDTLPGPHRETRPVQVLLPDGMRAMPSGLVVPS